MRNRIGLEAEASSLESRLQAAREPNIPPEGGTPARSCATELASSESSSLESRLQAARQTRFFMFIRMPENRPAPGCNAPVVLIVRIEASGSNCTNE